MYQDHWITDFTSAAFAEAFQQYFAELVISVRDWEGLFREMNEDPNGPNLACLRTDGRGKTIGFIQLCVCHTKNWFFSWEMGFIREFWIAEKYRNQGHGSSLLEQAEAYLKDQGVGWVMLTTDTAPGFYIRHGYTLRPEMAALNKDDVYLKKL